MAIAVDRVKLHRHLLHEYIENCPSLSVASPAGTVLRIDKAVLDWEFEIQLKETFHQYLFVNPETWTVSAKRFHARADNAQKLLSKVYILSKEEGTWALPLGDNTFEVLSDDDVGRLGLVARWIQSYTVFCPFEGWAITSLEADWPSSSSQFRCLREFKSKVSPQVTRRSPTEIAAEIVARFDADSRVTKSICRREWGADMKRDEFEAIWRMAAKERPKLSKRGPR